MGRVPGGARLRRLGVRACRVVGAGPWRGGRHVGVPRRGRVGRLLGHHSGEVALHPVRPLPLRRAVARGHLGRAVPGAVRAHDVAAAVEPCAAAGLARRDGAHPAADAWRRAGAAGGAHRPVGRPAGHADPRRLRAGRGVSAGGARGAVPSLRKPAAAAHAVRGVRGGGARRADRQRAVHGQRDVPAAAARRAERGQAAARGRGVHAVRGRLHVGVHPRCAAGHTARAARGGRRDGPGVLAEDDAGGPAAGAAAGGAVAREHVHRHLQGHLAGADHRHPRPAHRRAVFHAGAGVVGLQHRGVPVRRRHLLRVLRHGVALQPPPGAGRAGGPHDGAARGPIRRHFQPSRAGHGPYSARKCRTNASSSWSAAARGP
jgi:hypothetical protein